jgi:hypothetical protein
MEPFGTLRYPSPTLSRMKVVWISRRQIQLRSIRLVTTSTGAGRRLTASSDRFGHLERTSSKRHSRFTGTAITHLLGSLAKPKPRSGSQSSGLVCMRTLSKCLGRALSPFRLVLIQKFCSTPIVTSRRRQRTVVNPWRPPRNRNIAAIFAATFRISRASSSAKFLLLMLRIGTCNSGQPVTSRPPQWLTSFFEP